MTSGPNGYFYIKLAADGQPYTLEELVPNGYYGPEKVRFTVDRAAPSPRWRSFPPRAIPSGD